MTHCRSPHLRPACHWIVTVLALLAAMPPVAGQTVYLRTPGTGFCRVTAATNAAPVRLTVVNIAACGITANGQTILVTEVRGNTAANIHLESAGDTANLARKVANLSGNSFELTDLLDNPVAGNGAYVNGGRVGLATPYTLRQHPRLYLDGPSGGITTSVSSTAAGGRANPANLPFVALKNAVDSFNGSYGTLWGSDRSGNLTAAAALRWMADGDQASRDSAVFGVVNVTQVLGTPACDETQRGCYAPGSSVQDYPTQYMENFSQAYSIVRGELTAQERSSFLNFVLNDLPWTQGGFDYSGVSRTKPAWKISDKATSGTVSSSGTAVTGTGTHFLTDVAVGDIIMLPHSTENTYAVGYIVTAIASDTSLTIHQPINIPAGSHYMVGPQWNSSMYGLAWFSKHYEPSPLCGGASGIPELFFADCSSTYGTQAGIETSGTNNLVLARLQGYYSIGLATCGDDPRGCLLLSLANEWFVDKVLPRAMTIWTGFSQSSPGYHVGRMYNIITSLAVMSKNSFAEQPDYLTGTDFLAKGALWGVGGIIPQLFYMPFAESAGPYYLTAQMLRMPLLSVMAAPSSTEARQFRDWLVNRLNLYNESFIRYNGGEYVWWQFLYNDPSVTPMDSPLTALFPSTNRARCVAIYGTANCPADEGRYFAVSNQKRDWNSDGTYVALNGSGYKCLDHCADDLGGWILIAKNGKALLAPDYDTLIGGRPHRTYVELGGTVNNLRTYPDTVPVSVHWMAGDDQFMVANVDLTQTFKASAGASSVSRQLMHLKSGAQDYVLDHVRVLTASSMSIRGLQQFHLNGCGSPSSTTCVSMNRAAATVSNTQTGAKLTSTALGIGGDIAITTESGSETDGSYPDSAGKAFRWVVCPSNGSGSCGSATAAEWVVVHKPSTSPGDSMPPLVQSVSGAFRVVEIKDPVSPKVAVFTAAGATATSASFFTTHTGSAQYVVSGLAAGPYTVTRNGESLGIRVAAESGNSIAFEAPSGDFSVVPGPPPLTIANASVPNAVLGKPYNTTVSAFSSTTPYSWQLVSGQLCAGLTFNQVSEDAVISGVAEGLETCIFTLRVTNSSGTETDTREFAITVVEPGPPLEMATTWLPAGRLGDTYRGKLTAIGGTLPLRWSVSAGALCAGLAVDSGAGEIVGTPSQTGVCSFTVRATDLGNEIVERQFFIAVIENRQQSLYISSARASHSAAVLQFGRRGLQFEQACSLELRLGGPGGTILTTIDSTSGLSRRAVTATGLPSGQTVHAMVTCGGESSSATFETGFPPSAPRTVKLLFRPPAGAPPTSDLVLYYGSVPTMQNSLVASCSSGSCTAVISTDEPLIYWRAVYRDGAGNPLAASATTQMTPR